MKKYKIRLDNGKGTRKLQCFYIFRTLGARGSSALAGG